MIHLVGVLRRAGYQILFVSGRDEICREQTLRWLDQHDVAAPGEPLWMRRRKDNRPDTEVKLEIYKRHIEPHWHVAYVLDDRDAVVAMWRKLGLTCLQVATGDF